MNTTNKINLTEKEIECVEKHLRGEISMFNATDEEQATLMPVIEKAKALMEELNAYDELENDLLEWFMNKYKEQG